MAEKKETKKEKKSPYRVWIKPSIMERVEALKEADNCSSNGYSPWGHKESDMTVTKCTNNILILIQYINILSFYKVLMQLRIKLADLIFICNKTNNWNSFIYVFTV